MQLLVSALIHQPAGVQQRLQSRHDGLHALPSSLASLWLCAWKEPILVELLQPIAMQQSPLFL